MRGAHEVCELTGFAGNILPNLVDQLQICGDAMPARTLRVKMHLQIAKPPKVIFEAIVDPAKMSHYFISSGTDRLDTGRAVTWLFGDVGAELVVTPKRVQRNRQVSFVWSASKVTTKVVLRLEPRGRTSTLLTVDESGWPRDARGISRCIGQTRGWTHMLTCMKAYLEYGINLRKGGTIK